MKALLSLSAVLICAWGFSTSCHPSYSCNCRLKDTMVTDGNYSLNAKNASSASGQCHVIQEQHTGDTCTLAIFK